MNLAEKRITALVFVNWELMTRAEAFEELARRIGVTLRVSPEGKLVASGDREAAIAYLSDISSLYRGEIIAHLLELPAPAIDARREAEGFIRLAAALDAVMIEYCTAAGYEHSYLERLLQVRLRMAPAYLVQNLCAFRAWLFGLKRNHGT